MARKTREPSVKSVKRRIRLVRFVELLEQIEDLADAIKRAGTDGILQPDHAGNAQRAVWCLRCELLDGLP